MPPPYPSPVNGGGDRTAIAAPMCLQSPARAGRLRQELGPNLGGVLAERGHGAVAARRGVGARGRGGIADHTRGRGDLDAAQLRMHREIGGGVDAGKGDVVFRKFFVSAASSVAPNTAATRASVSPRR